MLKVLMILLIASSLATNAPAQEPSAQEEPAIVKTGMLFDTSGTACYERMQRLEDLKRTGFSNDAAWVDILNDKVDTKAFGVLANDWDEQTTAEFLASLELCSESPSMHSVWDADFLSVVRQEFPSYLAEKKRIILTAFRYHEPSASGSGISISCFDLLRYPAIGNNGNATAILPTEHTFGKKFLDFDDGDYEFISRKTSECKAATLKIQEYGNADLKNEMQLLDVLGKTISEQWKPLQLTMIEDHTTKAAAKAHAATISEEKNRRLNEPSFVERLADYMGKAGAAGMIMCAAMTAKPDKRYKNGLKGNWVAPRWMIVAFASSLGIFIISWIIG